VAQRDGGHVHQRVGGGLLGTAPLIGGVQGAVGIQRGRDRLGIEPGQPGDSPSMPSSVSNVFADRRACLRSSARAAAAASASASARSARPPEAVQVQLGRLGQQLTP
jgi:hypothetical protein